MYIYTHLPCISEGNPSFGRQEEDEEVRSGNKRK